jgi:hypothetical protein
MAPLRSAFLTLILLSAACSDSPTEPQRPPLVEIPADLAAVTFTTEGEPTAPYALLELRHPQGFRGFVAVNGAGQPVWFFRTAGNPFGATRRANGNLVLLDSQRGLVEVTGAGEVVNELAQQPRPGRFIHHDVTVTSSNTILFIAEDARPWPDTLVTGDAIWEWAPETGTVVRRWSSWDHLVPELDRGPRSRTDDWFHANSVFQGPRGNVLVSSPFLNQVVSIAPDYRSLEYRLGGVRATIPVDDPFDGQHTAAELSSGRVLVFDNGFARPGPRYSRAAEYSVTGGTARKVGEWRPPRDNFAPVVGAARRLPGGSTMVAFGVLEDANLGATGPIEVYELRASGAVAWHLTVGGQVASMYRATPLFEF